MATLREVFENRWCDADNAAAWVGEQDCVLRGFLGVGEWMALTLGDELAAEVMQAISITLTRDSKAAASDWRTTWLSAELVVPWPAFFTELNVLRAFANEGIYSPCSFAERDEMTAEQTELLKAGGDVGAWVRQCATVIDEFFRLTPEVSGTAPYDNLYRTRNKALARLHFDEGQPLAPQELADLSSVSLKRVQNAAYEKGGAGPVMNKHGRIEPEGAVEWLAKKGFRFSIWQQVQELGRLMPGWGDDREVDPALLVNDDLEEAMEEPEGVYIFVPVDRERSRFLPHVRRAGGYQIGPKMGEVYVADYFKALDALTRQPVPRWRRPNENGNWGIVSGVAWDRVLRADLERAAAQT